MQHSFTTDTMAIEAQARAMRAAVARSLVLSLIARLRGLRLPGGRAKPA